MNNLLHVGLILIISRVFTIQCRSERGGGGQGGLGSPKKVCQVAKVVFCCYPSILTGKTPYFMLIIFYTMRNVAFLVIKGTP